MDQDTLHRIAQTTNEVTRATLLDLQVKIDEFLSDAAIYKPEIASAELDKIVYELIKLEEEAGWAWHNEMNNAIQEYMQTAGSVVAVTSGTMYLTGGQGLIQRGVKAILRKNPKIAKRFQEIKDKLPYRRASDRRNAPGKPGTEGGVTPKTPSKGEPGGYKPSDAQAPDVTDTSGM